MLSSNVFHKHIDQHCYEVRIQNPSDDHIPIAIVRAAIDEILAIFRSERTFSISYDQAGKPSSYSMTPKSLRKSENFLGSTPTKRFWDWQGEIPASE
ncbi:hypothetical protein [Novosphingobium cyanobacteriorum]|uniref:Uncharacterized protein n=1 Tax=Novosphingobium cyanobacteriorum TaxID=3024215 RepID=A0ABT6CE10_9SPHN|nr:hypothetical protein [Novosphingobium cyanobacteriorum]MDF8332067.1 hypothetical protein [Novosphingobium cyanobacteriorum]